MMKEKTTALQVTSEQKAFKKIRNYSAEDFYKIINSEGNNEIKDWLAKLGSDRIDEIFDPSILAERAIDTWRAMGYSEEWISNKIDEIAELSSK